MTQPGRVAALCVVAVLALLSAGWLAVGEVGLIVGLVLVGVGCFVLAGVAAGRVGDGRP